MEVKSWGVRCLIFILEQENCYCFIDGSTGSSPSLHRIEFRWQMHKYLPEKRTMAMMRKHLSRFQDVNIGHHLKIDKEFNIEYNKSCFLKYSFLKKYIKIILLFFYLLKFNTSTLKQYKNIYKK